MLDENKAQKTESQRIENTMTMGKLREKKQTQKQKAEKDIQELGNEALYF